MFGNIEIQIVEGIIVKSLSAKLLMLPKQIHKDNIYVRQKRAFKNE